MTIFHLKNNKFVRLFVIFLQSSWNGRGLEDHAESYTITYCYIVSVFSLGVPDLFKTSHKAFRKNSSY